MARKQAWTPEPASFGPVYTTGNSFRARAEARQRRYRAEVLQAGWDRHGHWLDAQAVGRGANFVVPAAQAAAVQRRDAGKGVAERTFQNMLSSQAMCFNLFAPLADDTDLAASVLAPLLPGLVRVDAIAIEHTPAAEVFGDQTGRGGVDCDVLIEATFGDRAAVVVIETKFVEEEFSSCGFRRAGRAGRGQVVCPEDVPVRADRGACAYQGVKGYGYWRRSEEHRTLAELPARGCPFGGPLWQLWVNHALAHVEAASRGAGRAMFLVCASGDNEALLRGGRVLDDFRALLREPHTVGLLPLDGLIDRIGEVAGEGSEWARGLRRRYGRI
ncbi:hypothetical protein L6V77_34085 [Myxococcota bacterium]|nr:hypothetical protein [Myxococcota bacterium]